MKTKRSDIRQMALTAVMAAAVYTASAFLQIPIPTAIGTTRLHMGNVMCLLSGMLLGPFYGGMAAGLGSMLFDLTSPAYVTSAPFTFLFKFFMAWLCGRLLKKPGCPLALAAAAGAGSYVILYVLKSCIEGRLVLGMPMEAVLLVGVQKGAVSAVNGAVAVAVAVPLGRILGPVMKRLRQAE